MTSTTARDAPAATLAHLRARQASTTGPTVRTVVTGAVTGAERDRLAASLGALLRDARRARSWSGHQLAARIGAAASTVHRLENGTRRPRPVMLRCLADALAAGATTEQQEDITDAVSLLVAERDENTCRKDMTVTEKLAIGQRIEELRRPEAEERQAHGATAPGRPLNASSSLRGSVEGGDLNQETAALAASAVGLGRASYYAAKSVKRLAEDSEQPPAVREAAQAALADALYATLVAAAGPSLAEDTPGGVRRRQRRALRIQQTRTAAEWRRRRLVYEAWLRDQQAGLDSRRFAKAQAEHAAAFDAAITALDAAERAGSAAGQLAALERVRLLIDADPLQGVLDRRDWWQANLHHLLPD